MASALVFSAAFAQGPEVQNTIQMGVYFDEGQTSIPQNARHLLEARIKTLLGRNMMGATDDFAQFMVTCEANKLSTDILPGAPTKYREELEVNFYVIDAMAKKMFASECITVRGVANSDAQAYQEGIKQINSNNKALNAFFQQTAKKIISYYDSQYPVIITQAQALAKVKKYDEALFRLAMVPEACKGYNDIVACASEIFQKYIDHEAYANLAKATAIWNAGQDSESAYEAAEYLALINPDASCWADAVKLSNEIKATVKDNIKYDRRIAEKLIDNEHSEKMSSINAWREVGVAYGNNQKSNTYHDAWVVR